MTLTGPVAAERPPGRELLSCAEHFAAHIGHASHDRRCRIVEDTLAKKKKDEQKKKKKEKNQKKKKQEGGGQERREPKKRRERRGKGGGERLNSMEKNTPDKKGNKKKGKKRSPPLSFVPGCHWAALQADDLAHMTKDTFLRTPASSWRRDRAGRWLIREADCRYIRRGLTIVEEHGRRLRDARLVELHTDSSGNALLPPTSVRGQDRGQSRRRRAIVTSGITTSSIAPYGFRRGTALRARPNAATWQMRSVDPRDDRLRADPLFICAASLLGQFAGSRRVSTGPVVRPRLADGSPPQAPVPDD